LLAGPAGGGVALWRARLRPALSPRRGRYALERRGDGPAEARWQWWHRCGGRLARWRRDRRSDHRPERLPGYHRPGPASGRAGRVLARSLGLLLRLATTPRPRRAAADARHKGDRAPAPDQHPLVARRGPLRARRPAAERLRPLRLLPAPGDRRRGRPGARP